MRIQSHPKKPYSQTEDSTIPRKKPETLKAPRKATPRSPDSRQTAIKLASLALAWMKQEQTLGVRQREELRRAVATTADLRGWTETGADPAASAIKDVKNFTKAGSEYITEALSEEMARKKREVTQLQKVADSLYKLAETADFEEPIEVDYHHTAREGDGMATRTQTATLTNAGEATDAAAMIEKKLDNWEKLRLQMVENLKVEQRQLKDLEHVIPDFAEASRTVVGDVLAILH